MRLPTIALFTLATLIAGVANAQANPKESTIVPAQEQSTNLNSAVVQSALSGTSLSSIQLTAEIPQTELSTVDSNQTSLNDLVLTTDTKTEALPTEKGATESSIADANELLKGWQTENQPNTCSAQTPQTPQSNSSQQFQVAQGTRSCPRPDRISTLEVPEVSTEFESSPALSIYIPVGFGADRNSVFISGGYQNTTRDDADDNNGALGVGVGLGDADRLVGVELSYAFANFNDDIGEGGFNAKVHRRITDSLSIAAGYNGFVNLGHNDFEHSRYGVITKIFRTRESVRDPFSRLSISLGVGDGQFRSNGAVDAGDNAPNFFGNVAFRVIRPISLITEWTGQDLALGLSIAPFKNIPWVITPAVRDLVGAGDDPRFVLGSGISFQF
ncbi:MAG TPA: hypothetical protein V6D28_20280 [Leptolyngbyaceae cyanobacterium]